MAAVHLLERHQPVVGHAHLEASALAVKDDGSISCVPRDPEQVQEELTNLLANSLNIPLPAVPGRHQTPAGWVHCVDVPRYRGPEPVRFRGRVHVRHGRSSVEASPAELQELYSVFGFLHTEERVIPGATVADIDTDAFPSFLSRFGLELSEDSQPDLLSDLRNRGVIDDDGGVPRPTLYGLLCFGRQPQSRPSTRSAWVELVHYCGVDRASEVLVRGEAKGRLDEQVEKAVGWLRDLAIRETYRELERVDRPIVPLRALREALVNAVAHRDNAISGSRVLVEVFDDRIDITSPGELPNHLREASALAGGHPRSRNERIANFFLARGFMEMRGRRLPIIRHEMKLFNGTVPALESNRDGRCLRLTLSRAEGAS